MFWSEGAGTLFVMSLVVGPTRRQLLLTVLLLTVQTIVMSLSLSLVTLELPYNDYFEYFGPDFKLHISPTNMTNQNSPEYLEKIKVKLFENLRLIPAAPSVQMQRKNMLLVIFNFLQNL